jgi:hypothetical protein
VIKLTVDNLYKISRVVPLIIFGINFWLIIICIWTGTLSIDVLYGIVLLLQLFKIRIWRFYLLSDVYVNDNANEVVFKKLNGDEEIFNRKQIIRYATDSGMTDVILSSNGRNIKKYFIVKGPENLHFLEDGFHSSADNMNRLETYGPDSSPFRFNELRTRRALKKYGLWFFVPPLLVIPLVIIIGNFWAKKNDREISAMQFNGRVDSVWYNSNKKYAINSTPYVTIQGKVYYLSCYSWRFKQDIMPGDSLVKQPNTFTVTLIKPNGKRIIYKGD